MNKSLQATRLLAGVTLPGAARSRLLTEDAGLHLPQPKHRRVRRAAAKIDEESSLWIEEPMRFHRARYEHLTHHLHGRFQLVAALLSCLILLMLGLRATGGELVSPERWMCGLLSGWFIISMARLALFTFLAAPRGLCCAHGSLRISGLGTLHAKQILHWSIQREVRISPHAKPGAQLQLCCRWCGCERHWTMLMEEGQETERLQRLLEAQLPRSTQSRVESTPAIQRTIQIEAGILSQ
jgi:hypothetical protein